MTEDENEEEGNDYDDLLSRARKDLPDEISNHSRFKIPEIEAMVEGNTTILRNFTEIANKLNREPEKLLKYLLRELATAGDKENGRVVFKGKINPRKIRDKIESYVEKYVLCSECGRPDTRLVKDGRITILECDACGAHRPVRGKKKRVHKTAEAERIEEGGIYEVRIQDIGSKGDGVAKVGKYIIYVPGATKGEEVKIRVNSVKGTMAFANRL
ncbi:MAG: translation initiation factor IF-2 subunit beta [Candidatus Saliniplasma sp.]